MSDQLIGLQDLFATFSSILKVNLPDLREGDKGAEDSFDLTPALHGKPLPMRPMFYNDHKEGENGAACAMRIDNPAVDRKIVPGKWKIFFDDSLLREGRAQATQLFELSSDPMETKNRLPDENLKPLVRRLVSTALLYQ